MPPPEKPHPAGDDGVGLKCVWADPSLAGYRRELLAQGIARVDSAASIVATSALGDPAWSLADLDLQLALGQLIEAGLRDLAVASS